MLHSLYFCDIIMTALINLREGYKNDIICTPMEVLRNEEPEYD